MDAQAMEEERALWQVKMEMVGAAVSAIHQRAAAAMCHTSYMSLRGQISALAHEITEKVLALDIDAVPQDGDSRDGADALG